MSFNPVAAYLSSVAVASTQYAFDKWSISESSVLPEVTNLTGGGFVQKIPGISEASLKLSGPYDIGNLSTFSPGAQIDLILTFVGGTGVTSTVLVKSFSISGDVKDAERFECECESTGSFTVGPY